MSAALSALLALCFLAASSAEQAQVIIPGIPGSQVQTVKGAELLRGTLACFAKRGKWERNERLKSIAWIREQYGRETQCDRENKMFGPEQINGMGDGQSKVLEDMKWKWSMNKCPWEDLHYAGFCRTMWGAYGKKASILIVGDELSWGMERRFFYNLVATGPSKPVVVNLFPDGCFSWDRGQERKFCSGNRYCQDILGGDSVAVRFILSRNLSLARTSDLQNGVPWIQALSFWRPTVLVFTHTETGLSKMQFEENILSVYQWVKKHYPRTLVIYRANTLARGCPPPGEDSRFEEQSKENQASLLEENEVMKRMAMQWGALYLDVNAALQPRHVQGDCVSLCQQGPLDAWVQLLYNTLKVALPPAEMREEDRDMGSSTSLEKLTVDSYVRVAPTEAPKLNVAIPGSKIKTNTALGKVREQFRCFTHKGRWAYNPKPRLLPWPRKPVKEVQPCDARQNKSGGIFGAVADEVAMKGGNWSVREDLKYEWKSAHACKLKLFSRRAFCELMGPGRSILFVGDSMSVGFHRSLFFNLLVGHDTEKYPPVSLFPEGINEWDVGMRRSICEGYAHCQEIFDEPVEIRFCFNRGLTLTEVPVEGEAPWVLKLEEWKPSVIVLNRGAHYRSDDIFEPAVRDALYYIRSRMPKSLIVWRNTAPGHINCMKYDGPIATRQNAASLPPLFHWADFQRQNKIAKRYVQEVGGVYMDIDHSTALRPDGHRGFNEAGVPDCLHYCQPGVPDTWVLLLFNFLRELLK